ncbi:TolC family protein [Acinetobacter haemolyticus]|uniref:TolC family protein n=1 Tax=Acinetobacter haemolyticus TaxID=29430 RepID=UPI000E5733BD|nr:TolC family protein [Acinetobacter haemolyticus]NAR58290.1 TolC family protein [Acinetobacter haemolyticus]NAR80720.1 TolC family protein [Acinetobacter haemolyticus]NAR90676.1 TolC family protein [Acinetobacter haemolyticus]NAR96849.1 TolC family protein [Acinetobacter haemolyticus]QDJ91950.1 TolC family protein [Acinetobacter haemolyticus]
MSKIYQIFLTCGLVVTAAPAFAKQDYARLQQQVLANDAILQSLQQSQSAYDVNQQYAGRLNNPTFNVELDNLGNSKLKELDGPTTMIGLSQDIPLNNKLHLRKQLAGFQGSNNQFEIVKRQAELKSELRTCLSNWYVATQRAEIFSTESNLYKRQVNVLTEKLKYGRVIPSDVQLSSALSAESALRYQNELKKIQYQKNLCSKYLPDLPNQAIEVPLDSNFSNRVSLLEQESVLKTQLAKTQLELAKKEAVPDITLGVGVRNYQETSDKVFLVSTSIPLVVFNRNKGNIAIAQATQANAETQSVWANRNAKIELENKSVEISNLIDAIKQYDSTVLPAANESLRIAELGYQAGKISLLEFNSNKQIWLDKQLARYDLWLALQNQIAEIEKNYVTNLEQEYGEQHE